MPEMQNEFRAQGFVTVPDALDRDELAMMRRCCDALTDEPVDDGGNGRHKIGLGASRRFLAHRHEEFPALEAFLLGPKMAGLTSAVLGAPTYLFNEQFVVKGARTGASFAWHQDGYYVGFDHAPYVTVWIALDDATIQNGCVYVLPRDLDAEPGLDPHVWSDETREYNGYDGDEPGVAMTCRAGSVVMFSSTTLHRSGENVTEAPRRAFIGQYSVEPIIDPSTGKPKRFAKPLFEMA